MLTTSAVVLLSAWHGNLLAETAPPPVAGARHAAVPETLAASLPVRREASGNADAAAWASSWALLALGGGVGAWLLWQRSGRGRMRGAGRAARAPVLRLSSQALTPQASVHAVQWQGEEFLLGCTAQQVTLLCRKPVVTDAEPER